MTRIVLLGASYREDVGDTRYSGSELVVRILSDAKIQHYIELGCEVKGLGRGHIKRIKDRIRKK